MGEREGEMNYGRKEEGRKNGRKKRKKERDKDIESWLFTITHGVYL